MLSSNLFWFGLLVAQGQGGALGKPSFYNNLPEFTDKDIASGKALAELNKLALKGAEKQYNAKCNEKNVKVRKEWYVGKSFPYPLVLN